MFRILTGLGISGGVSRLQQGKIHAEHSAWGAYQVIIKIILVVSVTPERSAH